MDTSREFTVGIPVPRAWDGEGALASFSRDIFSFLVVLMPKWGNSEQVWITHTGRGPVKLIVTCKHGTGYMNA